MALPSCPSIGDEGLRPIPPRPPPAHGLASSRHLHKTVSRKEAPPRCFSEHQVAPLAPPPWWRQHSNLDGGGPGGRPTTAPHRPPCPVPCPPHYRLCPMSNVILSLHGFKEKLIRSSMELISDNYCSVYRVVGFIKSLFGSMAISMTLGSVSTHRRSWFL
jgi:hypothetical protein